jgi:2-keto-4-pentenoate hydratase/2-oxohepta-3-ene-1,7-dioic acid hydratase in catechol pathway
LTVLIYTSFPVLFYKPVTSLIGPLAPVVIPRAAQPPKEHLPDYEVELVIVIGKAAKNVSEADALDYVLGYTGANDVRNLNTICMNVVVNKLF